MDRTKTPRGDKHPLLRHLYHRWLEYKASKVDYTAIIKEASSITVARPLVADRLPPRLADRPGGYLIEVTNACNLHCKMCNTHKATRPKNHMPVGVFAQLLTRIKDEGITTVGLHTVGEPFVHPNLEEILQVCKSEGVVPALSTNAQFPQKIKALYKKGLLYGLRFSIDGLRDTYESIRQGGSWRKVIESLNVVWEINRGLHAYKLPLTIDCAVCSENAQQVRHRLLWAMSAYTFPHMIRFGIMNGLTPDRSYVNNTLLKDVNYIPAVPCSMPFSGIYFNNKGEATLCCRDYNNDLVIGSALNTPIQELWHSEAANEMRNAHVNGRIVVCNECYKADPIAGRLLNAQIRRNYYRKQQ